MIERDCLHNERLDKALNDLGAALKEVMELQKEATRKVSACDLQQEDILHYLEFGNPDAAQISQLVKALRSTRTERRRAKNEIQILSHIDGNKNAVQSLYDRSQKPVTKGMANQQYKFRTGIVADTIGDTATHIGLQTKKEGE